MCMFVCFGTIVRCSELCHCFKINFVNCRLQSMNETHEGIQQKKPFFKRSILRDVQSTLGSIKRSVSSRVSLKPAPLPEPPAEQSSESLPPYKELSFQKQGAEDVLKTLNKGYFEETFDAVDFELTEVQHPIVQEDLDSKVDQLTTALEVQFSQFLTLSSHSFPGRESAAL